MYPREIRSVPLLTAREEKELTEPIASGDEEAKDPMIRAVLLRLPCCGIS